MNLGWRLIFSSLKFYSCSSYRRQTTMNAIDKVFYYSNCNVLILSEKKIKIIFIWFFHCRSHSCASAKDLRIDDKKLRIDKKSWKITVWGRWIRILRTRDGLLKLLNLIFKIFFILILHRNKTIKKIKN